MDMGKIGCPNLQVKDLRKTSMIKFLMNDGTAASVDMKILD